MRNLDLDLPLDGTPASRFLLWITAGLVYLAVVALAIAAVADVQLTAFERQPRIVTVALPPNLDPNAARAEVDAVLDLLREQPGVAYASLITEEEIDSLVQPWLGADATSGGRPDSGGRDSIPLPRLIDIAYNPGADVPIDSLERELESLVPGATVGDAGLLQRSQESLALVFRTFGGIAGLVLVALTTLVVARITRINLGLHDETIDLLRQMGARDHYIARQFEYHALANGLRGALIGFVGALATIMTVLYLPPLLGYAPLLAAGLAPVHWVLLAIVPIATALLAAITARLAALFGLARLR